MAEKVAVLLCGYGEVEHYGDFAEYNERSFRLLVSKSIKFPDFSIPFLSRRLERTLEIWRCAVFAERDRGHRPWPDAEGRRGGPLPKRCATLAPLGVRVGRNRMCPCKATFCSSKRNTGAQQPRSLIGSLQRLRRPTGGTR